MMAYESNLVVILIIMYNALSKIKKKNVCVNGHRTMLVKHKIFYFFLIQFLSFFSIYVNFSVL